MKYKHAAALSPAGPTGVGGKLNAPQARSGSLTAADSVTYDSVDGVNSTEEIIGALAMNLNYKPKLTHEERRARLKQIAQKVRRTKMDDRRDALKGIAAEFKVSIPNVLRACKEFEVEIPPADPRGLSKQSMQIVKKLADGVRVADIAEKYGLSRARIYAIKEQALQAGILEIVDD